jgi:hypothetical protein
LRGSCVISRGARGKAIHGVVGLAQSVSQRIGENSVIFNYQDTHAM